MGRVLTKYGEHYESELIKSIRGIPLAIFVSTIFKIEEQVLMSSIKEDAVVYANCISEIKTRLAVVKKPPTKGVLEGMFYLEFMCLQMRKICELFAFSTLIANRQEYMKLRNEFEKDWNFTNIIRSVNKVNEKYFPEPLNPVLDETGKVTKYEGIKNDFLTIENIKDIYSQCCDFVHAQNHYKDLGNIYPGKYEEFLSWMTRLSDWRQKFIKLLNCHVIGVNTTELKRIYITYMHADDVNAEVKVISCK